MKGEKMKRCNVRRKVLSYRQKKGKKSSNDYVYRRKEIREKSKEENDLISLENGEDKCHDNMNTSQMDICKDAMNEMITNEKMEMHDNSQPSTLISNEIISIVDSNHESKGKDDSIVKKGCRE